MGSVLNLPLVCSTDPPHTRLSMRPPAHVHKMSSTPPPPQTKKKKVFSPFKLTPRSHQLQQPPQHRTDPPSTTPVPTRNRLRPTSIPDHPQLQPPPLGVQRKPTEQHVPQRRCDHDGVMAGKGGEYSADVATEPDCGSGGGMLYSHSAPLRSDDDGGGGL
ncbi:hypothetical protein EDB89DRAFT_1998883 [Lactarius sanguifluus]|nr:hypothetical protein EDB89DRAFT_1998879 [Lactarius sanguifluus]KAH9167182.1 hypothetical protein EDB89DRAFT_1998883 [Lactarius sanguifluus]